MSDNKLEVGGLNVILEWDTGSDLDIQVKCGCDNYWHGWGKRWFGYCSCSTCEMNRDQDVKWGQDGRTPVHEHVYFNNPGKMFGKTIGMAVYNYRQYSSKIRNDFKIALINKWGYQLFPNKGSPDIEHDPTWMYTTNESGSRSREMFYTFEKGDNDLGQGNAFIKHAELTKVNGVKWKFEMSDAIINKTDPVF